MTNFHIPNQENITTQIGSKTIYHFYNSESTPVFKTREILNNGNKIIVYPFSVRINTGQVSTKKIKQIEFIGFNGLQNVPKDFKTTSSYGIKSKRLKTLMALIYPKYKDFERLVIEINGKTRFSKKTISFNWGDLEDLLKKINRQLSKGDVEKKNMVINLLAGYSKQYSSIQKKLSSGELEEFLSRYDDFDKISAKDTEAIAKLFENLPKGKILTTNHIIAAKERIDTIYIEDIIAGFRKLLDVKKDNEEDWQKFFTKYSWMFSHLFPYQVILKKDKAYVGGKTIENSDGRIVDFLIESDLTKNLALIEIKTHIKELLKKAPYRVPDVFSISDELSGGINQCLDQKDIFLREMGEKNPSYDPKTILIIGQKHSLTSEQVKCFELFRSNQKNVDIVTFDELLSKLEGLHKAITGKLKKA